MRVWSQLLAHGDSAIVVRHVIHEQFHDYEAATGCFIWSREGYALAIKPGSLVGDRHRAVTVRVKLIGDVDGSTRVLLVAMLESVDDSLFQSDAKSSFFFPGGAVVMVLHVGDDEVDECF